MSKNEEDTVQADTAEELSPHNKALYEAGKSLLVESVSVGREFCKFMTTTALGAIPVYLALLKLVLPKDYVVQSRDEVLFLLPPVVFSSHPSSSFSGIFPNGVICRWIYRPKLNKSEARRSYGDNAMQPSLSSPSRLGSSMGHGRLLMHWGFRGEARHKSCFSRTNLIHYEA